MEDEREAEEERIADNLYIEALKVDANELIQLLRVDVSDAPHCTNGSDRYRMVIDTIERLSRAKKLAGSHSEGAVSKRGRSVDFVLARLWAFKRRLDSLGERHALIGRENVQ